jgi:hypothetical protein
VSETETLSLTEMQELMGRLKMGSAILFGVLQQVYKLHEMVEFDENEEEQQPICDHCSSLSGEVILYPCPTVQILLTEFSPVDQPSADQSEPDEPSDLHQ